MRIDTKFELGQTVFQIGRYLPEPVEIPCRFCRGTVSLRVDGKIEGEYEYVTCPRCRGAGVVRLYEIQKFKVTRDGRIGKIEVTRVDRTVDGFNGDSRRHDFNEERYMLDATGFPSGSIYVETDLFASEAEAEDECEVRNQAIEEGRWPGSKPDRQVVERLRAFLDHRDVYEHTEEHVRQAETLIRAYEYEPEEETT